MSKKGGEVCEERVSEVWMKGEWGVEREKGVAGNGVEGKNEDRMMAASKMWNSCGRRRN